MPKKNSFTQTLLKRFDKIDKQALQAHFSDLLTENETFQAVLDELDEGILILDPEAQIFFVNRQMRTWLGLSRDASLTGKTLEAMLETGLISVLRKHIAKLKEKTYFNFDLFSPRETHLECWLTPLFETTPLKYLAVFADQTNQKSIEASHDRIARIEAMISLAAGLAHEIGNPLNSLGIHLQLLKKEIKDLPSGRRQVIENSLNVMIEEASRLDRIVRNFLKASRKPPLRFKLEDFNSIAEQAVSFMEPEIKKKKIILDFRTDPKLPLFLMDHHRIYQALINLIKNALEAMGKAGRLRIYISHKDKAAFIRIQDDGKGIDEADLPHIFDAYYTTKEEGSGLGLMTVFNTISEHGGKIDVASKKGQGTTFTLLLPIRQPKLQLPNITNNK